MNIRPEIEQLDAQRQRLLSAVDGWSPARLAFKVALESWSALEIFDHLAKTESGIVAAARLGLASPHRIGIRDRLGVRFVQAIFRSDRKVKVPASASQVLPGPSPNMPAILGQWDAARQSAIDLGDAVSLDLQGRGIFRHPFAGWMTLADVLRFFSVHMQHHAFQLQRLRLASDKL